MFLALLFIGTFWLWVTKTPVPEWVPPVILAALAADGAIYKWRKGRG